MAWNSSSNLSLLRSALLRGRGGHSSFRFLAEDSWEGGVDIVDDDGVACDGVARESIGNCDCDEACDDGVDACVDGVEACDGVDIPNKDADDAAADADDANDEIDELEEKELPARASTEESDS